MIIESNKPEIITVNRFTPHGISLQVKFKPSAIGLQFYTDETLPI